MEVAIRAIGNSKGVVIPKAFLAQVGLDDQVRADIAVENDTIVVRKPEKSTRQGWARAAQAIAQNCEDDLLMGEFGNAGDGELNW